MQTITLYRYTRSDGGVTVSPQQPDEGTAYELRYRLIADEGLSLTNGEIFTQCTDTATPDAWQEVVGGDNTEELSDTGALDSHQKTLTNKIL